MPTPQPSGLDSEARSLADLCFEHLVAHPAELERFMSATGYGPDALRGALGSDALARGLIDHVAADEPLLLAICANQGVAPERFMRIWHRLNPAG